MSINSVAIIDYQMSNMYSLKNAIRTVGHIPKIVSNPNELLKNDIAILPGVGAYPEAVKHLKNLYFFDSIIEFVKTGKPFIGICLGLQLLFSKSLEFEETEGLNIIKGDVVGFNNNLVERIPHIGWNSIDLADQNYSRNKLFNNVKNNSFFYFIHSYYVKPEDKTVISTYTRYGKEYFTSSICNNNILGTQFHPEKSGAEGLKILENFLKS
tara:strand:- start:5183 stop:5815 length:633 start_codon:yes stop_codon:yes gene_type:complete